MSDIVARADHALLMALGMFWQTGWSLVLGFTIGGLLQATVSSDEMRRALGRPGLKEIATATAAGAASSSCSYASAAIMRTLFKKGAALVPSLAFLFASTNLVLELGLILLLLMGWPFMLGEWIGGLVLVIVMSLLVKLTYPKALIEPARKHEEAGGGHEHGSMVAEGASWRERLVDPKTRILTAQNFVMDATMLWKDIAAGFLIAGFLSAFVPADIWKSVFLTGQPAWIQVPANVLIGPLIAVVTFVCSIGNIPMAAVLWAGGAGFGGILAFIYADLIVIPLLDVYRRYFGWRMAAYLFAIFYATMAISALIVDLVFNALSLVPARDPNLTARITHFAFNYTFWLNVVFGALAIYLFWVNHRHPMQHGQGHPGHAHGDGGHRAHH